MYNTTRLIVSSGVSCCCIVYLVFCGAERDSVISAVKCNFLAQEQLLLLNTTEQDCQYQNRAYVSKCFSNCCGFTLVSTDRVRNTTRTKTRRSCVCVCVCLKKNQNAPRPSVCVCCHTIYSGRQVCGRISAGVTQEGGHRISQRSFCGARRIQTFLSLVDREVDFCVLTIDSFSICWAYVYIYIFLL